MKKFSIWLTFFILFISIGLPIEASVQSPIQLRTYYPNDIDDHWAYADLADFIQAGLLKGYGNSDGTLSILPDQPITRAEFVSILVRAMNGMMSANDVSDFADVSRGDWYYEPVRIAHSLGMVSGTDQIHFSPNNNITRAEISAILVRAFKSTVQFNGGAETFVDIANHWASGDILKASQAAIVGGYAGGVFKPDASATRAEAVSMIRRALNHETSEQPNDQEILQAINSTQDNYIFINANSGQDMVTTGFYHDYVNWTNSYTSELKSSGVLQDYKVVTEPKVNILLKSNRFASVQVQGGLLQYSYGRGADIRQVSEPINDIFYLMKIDGAWKVYGSDKSYNDAVGILYGLQNQE